MAKIKLYLDKRQVRPDGSFPLKIAINHNGSSSYILLGIDVKQEQWDDAAGKIISGAKRALLNERIRRKLYEAQEALLSLSDKGGVKRMSASELKTRIFKIMTGDEDETSAVGQFTEAFRRFLAKKEKPRTREIYEYTLQRLYKFCPELDTLGFEDITRDWLAAFDKFLAKTSPARNARNIHLRNIRAVFNDAIDDELTTAYPFRKMKIRNEETVKRSLTVEQLRTLFNYPVEPRQRQYLDMFILIFCLMGINITDLCALKPSDLSDGRISYRRAKTGKLYDIKVEPEAMEIINRHRGKAYLLDILDRYSNYKDYAQRLNRNLQEIGEVKIAGRGGRKTRRPLFPSITTYWARHSWATVAASLDIPKETISEALGHEIGSRVTSIYINFDRRKVDEANRRVLDWVLHGKK